LLKIVDYLYSKTKLENLCISWGVWLNCVANYKILKESKFKNIYVQPSTWDWGSSIWIFYYIYHKILKNNNRKVFNNIYLWENFSDIFIEKKLNNYKTKISFNKLNEKDLLEQI